MESQPALAASGVLVRLSSQLHWYWTLSPAGRAAFWATFGGWALDAYNQMTLGFVLPAVTAAFALSTTQAGLLGTVGLVMSAVGGAIAGAVADAIGRVRVLILSIGSYALAGPRVWRRVGCGRGACGGVRPSGAARASHRCCPERLVDRLCRRPDCRNQLRVTLASALLSVGVIGAGLAVWLPTYLEQVRHLTIEGLSAYMGIQVIGGFVGCISAGYVLDALGRRRGLAWFALGSALSAWAYVVLPLDAAWLVFAIGFPLGFFGSGIFSGLAVYLAELYPTELRGAAQGFGYNIGRGIGAVGPAAIGVAAARVGLSDALALAATSYVLCLLALLFLPETRGKHLTG
jgi:MFS family permease